jgi:hypothetical protein
MVGILSQVLSGGGIRRSQLVKRILAEPRVEFARLSQTTARPGDVVRISTRALDSVGLFMSPFGEPSALTFVQAAPHPTTGGSRCVSQANQIVWADYRVRDDAPPGQAAMAIALFENVGTGCNGDGRLRARTDTAVVIEVPPPAPTPAPEPTPAPTPTPPPEEEPVPFLCRIPILKQFFCP